MKRRTFLLTGGTLLTISFSITATSAEFVDTVNPVSDFHVVPKKPNASLDLDDNTENVATTHTWVIDDITTDTSVDSITATYPEGTSFDELTAKDDIIVEFRQSNGRLQEVKLRDATYRGYLATFEIDDNNDMIYGDARITIQGLENPDAGEYEPELTFTNTNGEEGDFTATMGISSGDAIFLVTGFSPPDSVSSGEDIIVDYTIENDNSALGSQTVTFLVDGSEEDSTTVTLEGQESYDGTFSYTATDDDVPEIPVEVATEDDRADSLVGVGGAWDLTLQDSKQNTTTTHMWSTPFLDFNGEVDTITVTYPSDIDFNGLTEEDISVSITREGESGPQPITVLADNYNGSEATFDLDPNDDTDVDGEINVDISGLRNPNPGTYEATIELVNYDESDTNADTVQFTVG